jgi:hypothetical protein
MTCSPPECCVAPGSSPRHQPSYRLAVVLFRDTKLAIDSPPELDRWLAELAEPTLTFAEQLDAPTWTRGNR